MWPHDTCEAVCATAGAVPSPTHRAHSEYAGHHARAWNFLRADIPWQPDDHLEVCATSGTQFTARDGSTVSTGLLAYAEWDAPGVVGVLGLIAFVSPAVVVWRDDHGD